MNLRTCESFVPEGGWCLCPTQLRLLATSLSRPIRFRMGSVETPQCIAPILSTKYVLHSDIPLAGTGEMPLRREGCHADKESTHRNR
jgi:hypothetical protein